jgi:4'-phosphopantetheinyl transferase
MEMDSGFTQWLQPPEHLLLPENEVHVWRAELELPRLLLEKLDSSLSSDEKERAVRFHFDKDRRHFTAGRGILRVLLGSYLRSAPGEIEFSYTNYGKPFLARCDGRSLRFNVSHSEGLALFAFSENREVGIDVEQMNPKLEEEHIAARFFSQSEVSSLRRLPQHMRIEAFYNCWTRKEAYIKGVGKGLSLPLDSFDVSLHPDEPASLLGIRDDSESLFRWTLHSLEPGSGYKGAIVAEGNDWVLRCWNWIK